MFCTASSTGDKGFTLLDEQGNQHATCMQPTIMPVSLQQGLTLSHTFAGRVTRPVAQPQGGAAACSNLDRPLGQVTLAFEIHTAMLAYLKLPQSVLE